MINHDQAIFDAIAAATDHNDDGIFVDVQKFINTFNNHRDRKLCTSLDVAQTPCGECHLQDGEVCDICSRSYGLAQKASVPITQPFTGTEEAMHYLGAIKVRLELLYEHSTQDARLLEHLSDEIDWVDAEIDRLRSGGVAKAPRVQADYAAVVAERDRAIAACEKLSLRAAQASGRIEALETALRHIEDALGYDKNEGKSPAVRESNAHIAWKIARATLAPEQDK
jgi:hypothetical protein